MISLVFVRFAGAFAALLLASGIASAQSPKPSDPQMTIRLASEKIPLCDFSPDWRGYQLMRGLNQAKR